MTPHPSSPVQQKPGTGPSTPQAPISPTKSNTGSDAQPPSVFNRSGGSSPTSVTHASGKRDHEDETTGADELTMMDDQDATDSETGGVEDDDGDDQEDNVEEDEDVENDDDEEDDENIEMASSSSTTNMDVDIPDESNAGSTPNSPVIRPSVNSEVYRSEYNGILVYEMICQGVPVMRRISDSYLNANQILRLAGLNKAKQTNILEKDVLTGHHENISSGFEEYQGTWIPMESGRQLARRFNVETILLPILDCKDEDLDKTMTKSQYMASQDVSDTLRNFSVAATSAPASGSSTPNIGSPKIKRKQGKKSRRVLENDDLDSINSPRSTPHRSNDAGEGTVDREIPPPRKEKPMSAAQAKLAKLNRAYNNLLSKTESAASSATSLVAPSEKSEPAVSAPVVGPLKVSSHETQKEIILSIFVNGDPNTVMHHLKKEMISIGGVEPICVAADMILDDKKNTALHWASTYARAPLIQTLLQHGANVRAVNSEGETALHRAVSSTTSFDSQNFLEILALLGGVMRSADYKGHTLLHRIATKAGAQDHATASIYYLRCVASFIEDGGFEDAISRVGSDGVSSKTLAKRLNLLINAQDGDGNTALHLAVKSRCRPVISMLVQMGAETGLKNDEGLTPAALAEGDERVLAAVRGEPLNKRAPPKQVSESTEPKLTEPPVFRSQLEAARTELIDLHRSQDRLAYLHQQADLLKTRIISFKNPQHTSSGSESEHPTSKRSEKVPSVTTPSPVAAPTSSQLVPDDFHIAPSTSSSLGTSSSTSPPPPSSSTPATSSGVGLPTPLLTPTLTPAPTPLLSNHVAPRPTSTSNRSSASMESELRLLKQKLEASAKSRKRMLEELESVWNSRADKDKRYKKMMAMACMVSVEKVEEVMGRMSAGEQV
ncbi:transcriptional regulator swi6 [Chytridiales sp. JEL 0842]|nr:transcriptional regulator swi6 [Chytridiales sp. JEL 0842]